MQSDSINLYRKRYIPDELIQLADDTIISVDEDTLITKWTAIRPRTDIVGGVSVYYLKRGFKISRFLRGDGSLLYWYCDIIDAKINADSNEYIIEDLLVDIIVRPDGFVKVVDMNELAEAHEKHLITDDTLHKALIRANDLLGYIYAGRFDSLIECIRGIDL